MTTIIEFCCKGKCPIAQINEETVILGDENGPEGITVWKLDQFKDFVSAVKEGKFDFIDDLKK